VVEDIVVAGNIPGKEINMRCALSPEQMKKSWISYGKRGYLSARAFVAEGAGRIINHPGGTVRMIVPVV
jgi:hypothetical protein